MAVHSSGLETLVEALRQQDFKATDELGLSVIYQRPDDALRVHLGFDGSFTALDGHDEVIVEGTSTEDLYAILVSKTVVAATAGRRSRRGAREKMRA
jgi:hypothetical protein